jgi:hypothetical protein
MTEFPSSVEPSIVEPSIVQGIVMRRLRRERWQKYTMPKIRSRARKPAMEPSAMVRFALGVTPRLPVDEMLDDEEALDDEVLDDEEMLDDKEALDEEEALDDEDVVEDDVGTISVYLHRKSVEEIVIINGRMQTLEHLRSHNRVSAAQRILRAYVVYSPILWSTRRLGMAQSHLTLYQHCDQRGRPQ